MKKNNIQFKPNNPQLFLINISKSKDYYITKYLTNGTFKYVIDYYHKKPRGIEEPVAYYYLIQMLSIIKDLEDNSVSHGNINASNLLNRITTNELPKEFNDDNSWKEQGIALCCCDNLKNEEGHDRYSIALIYYYLCTKTKLEQKPDNCPRRWNESIWKQTFDILLSNKNPQGLISILIKELQQPSKGLQIRSSLSRINVSLMEQLSENPE